jgi:hypothetical protein
MIFLSFATNYTNLHELLVKIRVIRVSFHLVNFTARQ